MKRAKARVKRTARAETTISRGEISREKKKEKKRIRKEDKGAARRSVEKRERKRGREIVFRYSPRV